MLIEGYPESKIKTLVDVNNTHSESAWSSVFPASYKWFIDTIDANSESVPVINDSSKSVDFDAWSYRHLLLIDAVYYLLQHLNSR